MAHRLTLRIDYVAAAIATATLGWAAFSGGVAGVLVAAKAKHGESVPSVMQNLFIYVPGTMALLGVALFLYLALRPHWLGKVLCAWAGVSWIGFAVVASKLHISSASTLSVGIAGVVMLICTLTRWTITLPSDNSQA